MKKALLVLFVCVWLTNSAWSDQLDLAQVSAEANWLVHFDYDQFNGSTISKLVSEELAKPDVEAEIAKFVEIFSFHPLNDIRGITLYGRDDDPEKALVIIKGQFERATLLGLLDQAQNHQIIPYETFDIHSWLTDKNEMAYGAFFTDNTVLLASRLNSVQQGLSVLGGTLENAQVRGQFTLIQPTQQGEFFQVAATDFSHMVQDDDAPYVLKNTRELNLAVGEWQGNLFFDFTCDVAEAQRAVNVANLFKGIFAVTALVFEKKLPEVTQFAQDVQIVSEGNIVYVSASINSQKVISYIKILQLLQEIKK
ncbi:MAG: hypothetical protein AMJ79_11045 [Phycisphaerae bacterium SM23_30]|nr:MAG: hypothetical protein AMJ79_11045 [Phycisphaerae bacterium SM23_30]